MDNKELLKYILPVEFSKDFELLSVRSEGERLIFDLDELNIKPTEHKDKELISKGFTSVIKILDFPIRDKAVILHVRCRRWKDKDTGKVYTRDWDLKAKGTSYSKEFGLFLKKNNRQ